MTKVEFCFYLLGGFQVIQNQRQTLSYPYRLQSLLSFLLLRPQSQHRELIIDALYPHASPEQGRRMLSDALYLLRKTLPDGIIFADRDRISLDIAGRWLDVEAFRQAMASASPVYWESGIELYRGDLLPGNYEDWLLEEREALHMDFITLCHRFCETMAREHAYERAQPVAKRLLREEPYDEEALQRLMQIYQAQGLRGHALQVYEQFVARMATDLGVEPHPGLQLLAETIRDACPVLRSQDVQPLTASDDPTVVLQRAQRTFDLGERAQTEALLAQLQRIHDTDQTRHLEFDLALRFGDTMRAQRTLQHCDPDHPATAARNAALQLEQRDWKAARSAAEDALLSAISRQNQEAEALALWVLANAEYRLGQRASAYRTGERGLAVVRKYDLRVLTIEFVVFLGRMMVIEGRFDQASALTTEAITLAQRHDDPWMYAQAMRLSGLLHLRTGRLLAAQHAYEEALRVCRHVGGMIQEARILNELAESYDLLGQSHHSLRLLKQAEALLAQLDDPVPLAITLYNQAFTYLYLGDDHCKQAVLVAHSALAVFQEAGLQRWIALSSLALAYGLWIDQAYDQALAALDASYRIHEELGEGEKFCEILAMKTHVLLEMSRLTEALACSERMLLSLAQGTRATDMKVEVYFARGAALAAAGDATQATNFLQRAYETLVDIASGLADEPARRAFFRRDPITRRLMQQVYRLGLAKPLEAGQETHWVLERGSEQATQVRWTIDAGPADAALKRAKGAIAVRRERLARLIREAKAQGIEPTNADLAAALSVSVRTIQRDLAKVQVRE